MTALTIFNDGNTASIVTDGATCLGNRPFSYESKQWVIPHLGLACGFRGNAGVGKRLRLVMSGYQTVETMTIELPIVTRRMSILQRLFPKAWEFDVAIAGHDGRQAFAYLFSSVQRPGAAPYVLQPVSFIWSSPNVEDLGAYAQALLTDFDASAIALVDEQRVKGDVVVGGYIQATGVTPSGITTRCLKHYRDEPYKQIMRTNTAPRQVAVKPVKAVDWRML